MCVLRGYAYDERRSPNSCYCCWGDAQWLSGPCSAQPRTQVHGCCCLLVGFKLCLCPAHLSWCMLQPNKPISEKSYFLKTSFSGVFVNLWNSRSDFISFQTFMMVLSSVRSFSCSASRSFRVCLWDGISDGLVSVVLVCEMLIMLHDCILKWTAARLNPRFYGEL